MDDTSTYVLGSLLSITHKEKKLCNLRFMLVNFGEISLRVMVVSV